MFELNQKLLTINNYVGEIIEIKNKEITVFLKKIIVYNILKNINLIL